MKTIYNLLNTKKEIHVVNDQFGTPTSAKDISKILLQILCSKNFYKIVKRIGIYNISSNFKISWYGFACEIARYAKNKKIIHPISTSQYKFKTLRPSNSSLECDKIKKTFGIKLPKWNNSLKKCIISLNKL